MRWLIVLFAFSAQAAPTSDEVKCLKALARFEYGKTLKSNSHAIVLRDEDHKPFAWDGKKLWELGKGAEILTPWKNSSVEGVKIREVSKKAVWSADQFDDDGDGRPNKMFSAARLESLVKDYIHHSFEVFWRRRNRAVQFRKDVSESCQEVTSVVLIHPRTKAKIIVSDASKRLINPLPPQDRVPASEGSEASSDPEAGGPFDETGAP